MMGMFSVISLCPNTSHHGKELLKGLFHALVAWFLIFHSKRRRSYISILYFSLACVKELDQNQLGQESVYWLPNHSSPLRKVKPVIQDKNQDMDVKAGP